MIWFLKFYFLCGLFGHQPLPPTQAQMINNPKETRPFRERFLFQDGSLFVCRRCHLVYWVPIAEIRENKEGIYTEMEQYR
jgi:hypothetical protein